ncbi:MAG: hypothetical protein U0176_26100 [Bacteroidia bacterium]
MSMFQRKEVAPILRKQEPAKTASAPSKETLPVKAPPKFGLTATNNEPVQKKDLLNEKKLEAARAFYTSKTEFTAEVICEMQTKLGIAATGAFDDATLQAIAKAQKAAGMTPDGMLGPKSLPKLFAHGLATEEVEQEFAQDYLGVDWSSLKTADERGGKMVELINKQLKAAGVPECAYRVEDLGDDSGQFDFTDWNILVGNDFLSKAKLTTKQLNDFANTVIHEARHAEQWFNMAQNLAGEGKKAKDIADEMGIPLRIAKAAVANPTGKQTVKHAVAKNWYESVYGSGSEHREKTLGDEGTYEDYRNLPEEHDAWRVGDEFDVTLKKERKIKDKQEALKKKEAKKVAKAAKKAPKDTTEKKSKK